MFGEILQLLSRLPPGAYDLLANLIKAIASSKSDEEAMDKLRRAALAAGYKAGMRATADAALAARKKALGK